MTRIHKVLALLALSAVLSTGFGFAQEHHDNQHYVRHDEWKKGQHIRPEDWKRGDRIDYHKYHLNAPPRGYEWREVDGNYVLAAVATGVIASVIVASAAH